MSDAEEFAGEDEEEFAATPEDDSREPAPVEKEAAPAAAPGGEMFSDVVGKEGKSMRGGPARLSGDSGDGDVQLRDSVAGLYEMVKDLEVQLNHMISINEAGERDLEVARRGQRDLEKERDTLQRRIEQAEQDAQSSAELRDELRYSTTENERLIEQLDAKDAKGERWEQERKLLGGKLAVAHSEITDLREEVDCLEAQLGQAGKHIESLRETISRSRDASVQQTRRAELVEERLRLVTDERDAMKRELNESRSALEEIKRSIMDTNLQSQRSYYEA